MEKFEVPYGRDVSSSYPDGRLSTGASERNREPILAVLRDVLPASGVVLEVASGAGVHVHHFAQALEALTWQPSDPQTDMRRSIDAWVRRAKLDNVRPGLDLDVTTDHWAVGEVDAIVNINMIHASPWETTLGLFRGAARHLRGEGPLTLYGPFRFDGLHTTASNAAFDETLRREDPSWGVRDLQRIETVAETQGFSLVDQREMPANNWLVVFRKRAL
ncbi:MAG: DUF938 domain-containing protein [Myxococcota bacterium]|nr:DUF938 domain-containing protein [Myxococcota bacterium]